jgi:hypothetical protein
MKSDIKDEEKVGGKIEIVKINKNEDIKIINL